MTNVPPGWKLVPEMPTTEMLRAGQTAWLNDSERRSTTLYVAMVAAAAAPPPSDAYVRGWTDGRDAAAKVVGALSDRADAIADASIERADNPGAAASSLAYGLLNMAAGAIAPSPCREARMGDVEDAITVIEGAAAALEAATTTGTAAEITGAQCDLSRAYADHVPTLIAAWRRERAENDRLRAILNVLRDAEITRCAVEKIESDLDVTERADG